MTVSEKIECIRERIGESVDCAIAVSVNAQVQYGSFRCCFTGNCAICPMWTSIFYPRGIRINLTGDRVVA